jgi:hypothetical protein
MGECSQPPVSQQDHAHALSEVSDVMIGIDRAIVQARSARMRLWNTPAEYDIKFALDDAVDMLQRVKVRLYGDIPVDSSPDRGGSLRSGGNVSDRVALGRLISQMWVDSTVANAHQLGYSTTGVPRD